jgi:hypothetical protein
MKQDSITDLLSERGKTHGDFAVHAHFTQRLKDAMWSEQFEALPDTHKEALEMIAHKIGRILAGDPNFKDHWLDISGYACLISNRL